MAVLKYLDTSEGKREWREFFIAEPGISYIPTIDSETLELSWSNNAGLPNPESVILKASGIEMYPSIAEFPVEGNKSLYLDLTTNILYRYNKETHNYVPLQTTDDSPRSVEIVTTLPTTNINPSTIYCMRYYDSNDDVNRFDEYMWVNNDWELISSSSREGKVDESQRATEEDVRHLFG